MVVRPMPGEPVGNTPRAIVFGTPAGQRSPLSGYRLTSKGQELPGPGPFPLVAIPRRSQAAGIKCACTIGPDHRGNNEGKPVESPSGDVGAHSGCRGEESTENDP